MRLTLGKTVLCLCLSLLTLYEVVFSGCHHNNYPVIDSLKADMEWVEPSDSCEITCLASDADGDILTYAWSANGGIISGQGPVVTWTAPEIANTYIITITVTDGKDGTAEQLALDVVKVNHPPVISGLKAEPPAVRVTETSEIKCVASDPDDDELYYLWEATGGLICGQGTDVAWIAPPTSGSYVITVRVMDSSCATATGQLAVEALPNHPPVIESLTADPPSVRQGKTSSIACVASDPDGDELEYVWAADSGSISGEGPAITWTAPNTCGDSVITLTVSDDRGEEVIQEIVIPVKAG